jgi:uncharacterized protein YbcV (DUF1398 family)
MPGVRFEPDAAAGDCLVTDATGMFTIEQINEIHDRFGTMEHFADYVRALKAIGVERYDSYLSDGHSEYFAEDGRSVVSSPAHETLPVTDFGDRDRVLEHLRLHELGRTSYLEMSKGLADSGVEKWIIDTNAMTLTYVDKQGSDLVTEAILSSS